MEKKFTETVTDFLMGESYRRILSTEPDNINQELLDDIFDNPVVLIFNTQQDDVHKDMIIVQMKEAFEEGYIHGLGEEGDFLDLSMNVRPFDFTDKGKEYFTLLLKSKIEEKVNKVLEAVKAL